MSATRPATEFSIGIMASLRLAAFHRGKRVLEGGAGERLHRGKASRQARCELAPGSP